MLHVHRDSYSAALHLTNGHCGVGGGSCPSRPFTFFQRSAVPPLSSRFLASEGWRGGANIIYSIQYERLSVVAAHLPWRRPAALSSSSVMVGGSSTSQANRATVWVSPSTRARQKQRTMPAPVSPSARVTSVDKRCWYFWFRGCCSHRHSGEVESDLYGSPSPEGERKPRTCVLPATRHLP